MSPVLLLALQASSQPLAGATPGNFDLEEVVDARPKGWSAGQGCSGTTGSEIVVCGRRDPDRYRYREPAARPEWLEDAVPRAEMGLGNGATGGLELEQVANPDGTVSKRIMVRVRTKF